MTTEEFIRDYRNDDVRRLALQAARHPGVDMPYALDQIAGWQVACRKIPSWAATEGVVYPPHVSMEQCSGEHAARYKASLVVGESGVGTRELPGGTPRHGDNASSVFVDLTGGLGVDFSFMAGSFGRVVYVERQEYLCDMARKNFSLLGLDNAEVVCGDGVEYLHALGHASLVYLDPARRDDNGSRTYAIADCAPDILGILPELLEKSDRVMVKLSPMLDWHDVVKSLHGICPGCVAEVHVVSVCNECKELLVVMTKGSVLPIEVYCVNLHKETWDVRDTIAGKVAADGGMPEADVVSYVYDDNEVPVRVSPFSTLCPEHSYLYEPNASIMKAGCFGLLCERYGVSAIARNSHLFVSENKVTGFPGRTFRIRAVSSMNKKELKRVLSGVSRANVAVRNFPMSVAELRKRLKIDDGGDTYMFATTTEDGRRVLILAGKDRLCGC